MSVMIRGAAFLLALGMVGACAGIGPAEDPAATKEDVIWPEGSIPASLTLA